MSQFTVRRGWVAAARWTYGVIAAVILLSLVIQLALLFNGGDDANSGASFAALSIPLRLWRLFSFFTIDSNVVVLIVSLLLLANPARRGRWWDVLRLNSLLAITITGLVYAAVLAPIVHSTGWALVATIGFHYVSPWMTVAAWLLFGPRPGFRWGALPGAFVLPVVWLVYIFTQGAFTHWYPYPFLDVNHLGLGASFANSLLVIVVAAVLGLVFKIIDATTPSALRAP